MQIAVWLFASIGSALGWSFSVAIGLDSFAENGVAIIWHSGPIVADPSVDELRILWDQAKRRHFPARTSSLDSSCAVT